MEPLSYHAEHTSVTRGCPLVRETPVRGDTGPGMSRGRVVTSHVTPPEGVAWDSPSWAGVEGARG